VITVSALMATTKRRASFLPQALESFRQQQFPSDWQVELVIDEHETSTLGRKLNDMAARCSSEFLLVWDDDDFYMPTRIAKQIQPLAENPALMATGTSRIVYRNDAGRAFLYSGNGSWIGAIAFRRTAWERVKFEDFSPGVDYRWLKNFKPEEKFDLKDDSLFLAAIHSQNTCPKQTSGREWKELPRVPEYLQG
jgi:glycosyltransferase involved in cell wall biosynthesis